MHTRRVVAVALALSCLVALPAAAGAPTDQLRGSIERVVRILDDPALKADGSLQERRTRIRTVAVDIFDFAEIARRSLARHWQPLTEVQRKDFVALFSDLLERSYISKIELYGGEKIIYGNERTDGDLATVATKIIAKGGTDVPVDYRLAKKGDRWLVYDVNIEGVSLVSNYRTQFNKIIQTESFAELMRRLKTKQDELVADTDPQKKKPK